MRSGIAVTAAALALAACSGEKKELTAVERGKAVYQNVCIACHNGDPTKDGSLGPSIAGASKELLEARVIHGEYPPGYTPKRPNSGAMPKFEYLADRIDDLAVYLAQFEPAS